MTLPSETKKRIEMVVERSLVSTVVEAFEAAGARGYTALPCLEGRGRHGNWKSGDLSPAFDRIYLLVIASEEVADAILQKVAPFLSRYSLVLTVSEAQVIRGDNF